MRYSFDTPTLASPTETLPRYECELLYGGACGKTDVCTSTGSSSSAGLVVKALADLTKSKELVNRKDKRGYRLPGWIKRQPGLFDDA